MAETDMGIKKKSTILLVLALLVAAAGLGAYLVFRTSAIPEASIPKGQRSEILDEAKAKGIIHDYRLLDWRLYRSGWAYEADGGQIFLRLRGTPFAPGSTPQLFIEYIHSAADKARAIQKIAPWGHLVECGPC